MKQAFALYKHSNEKVNAVLRYVADMDAHETGVAEDPPVDESLPGDEFDEVLYYSTFPVGVANHLEKNGLDFCIVKCWIADITELADSSDDAKTDDK